MNPCVECIHYSEFFDHYEQNHVKKLCMRPIDKVDLVTGKNIPRFVGCYFERSRIANFLGGCGPSGKFFVERPTVKLNPPGKE